VLEDGLGGGGAKDDGDDAPGASAARAGEDVGAEGPPEELGPGDGAAGPARAEGLRCRRARGCLCQRRRGDEAGADPSVGGEDAEVPDEVGPGRRDQRSQTPEEGDRSEDEVRLSGGRGPFRPVALHG